MGYVHVTDICQFIPPQAMHFSAGTWTTTVAANVTTYNRTAADSDWVITIPLTLPGSNIALQGAKLVSIDVWYIIATAACDSFEDPILQKITLPASGTAPTGEAVSITMDTAHDVTDERRAADEHKMTITLDTAAFVEDDVAYVLYLQINAAATSVFKMVGCQVNYTLRL